MLISALIFGILGSFHCVGMCGPIAFMLPVSRTSSTKKRIQLLLYHLGRLLAYGSIGLLFGMLGKTLNLFGIQQQLSILTGSLMIALIVLPSGRVQRIGLAKPLYRLIGKIKSALGEALKKKTLDTFFTIGFLNGFLPCGLVYMAVLGAIASGGTLQGGLYMILFGVGTVPLMTIAIYFSTMLKGLVRRKIQQAIPVFVVLIGALFILRGLGLGIPYISPAPASEMVTSSVSCH